MIGHRFISRTGFDDGGGTAYRRSMSDGSSASRDAEASRLIAGGERMPEKSMKEKLAAGELVLCMNLRLARSVDIAMVAKAGGYDALYVDMQHAPYSIETTATIFAR